MPAAADAVRDRRFSCRPQGRVAAVRRRRCQTDDRGLPFAAADRDRDGPLVADRDRIGPFVADQDRDGPISTDRDRVGPLAVDRDRRLPIVAVGRDRGQPISADRDRRLPIAAADRDRGAGMVGRGDRPGAARVAAVRRREADRRVHGRGVRGGPQGVDVPRRRHRYDRRVLAGADDHPAVRLRAPPLPSARRPSVDVRGKEEANVRVVDGRSQTYCFREFYSCRPSETRTDGGK